VSNNFSFILLTLIRFLLQVSIDSPNNLHCTGTIINPQHVLTTASCVTTSAGLLINQFWVTIIAGDLTLVPESIRRETRSVIRMYVHPSFSWITQANDLAVLRVKFSSFLIEGSDYFILFFVILTGKSTISRIS
jgi:secreted trypsin-like serine protease